jgi:deoxyhypusine synthase
MTDPAADPATYSSTARESVLKPSDALPADAVHIKGPDLSHPIDLQQLLGAYETIGFQATGVARAIKVVEEMVRRTWWDWIDLWSC